MPARHLELGAALMTPARWEQIKSVFHATLEHEHAQRPAFLARACADDELLRDEVESLLASHEQAESFIETPASDVAAALLAEDQPGLPAGQMVGHFRIANVLATGGMGEVYLADDTRLGRKIALFPISKHVINQHHKTAANFNSASSLFSKRGQDRVLGQKKHI